MVRHLKLLAIYLVFFFSTVHSQDFWYKIGDFSQYDLYKCSFVDTLKGWAAGDSGTILYTSNGGLNWVAQSSHISEAIVALQFINERIGWGLALATSPEYWGTIILKTTNGGLVWDTSKYYVSDIYLRTLFFLDSLTGYMGSGNPSIIIKTTNGGANWNECYVDSTSLFGKFGINKIRFINEQYGYACGGHYDIAGVFWKTTDYGNFWTAFPISAEPNFDMKVFDTNRIVALGGDYEYGASLSSTSNGGLNWGYVNLEIMGIPRDMEFRTETEGWSPLGYAPIFLKTTDAGVRWLPFYTPDTSQIFDIEFVNDRFGICVGTHGTVLRFNSTSINIQNPVTNLPEVVNLFQNYPNPFNPETNIGFSINETKYIELKIYNLLGQEINVLFKGTKSPGTYSFKFNNPNLPSGIYYYKLYTKSVINGVELTKSKKMILLK